MKKLSKTLALLLALTMVLCLAACGGSKDALSGTWPTWVMTALSHGRSMGKANAPWRIPT